MGTGNPATLEQLLAGSYATRTNRICWARDVDGLLKEYLDSLIAQCDAGRQPVWARVTEILETSFDIRVNYGTVKNHVLRRCLCHR